MRDNKIAKSAKECKPLEPAVAHKMRKTYNPIKLYKEFDAWWQRIALICVFILVATIAIEALNFIGYAFGVMQLQFSVEFMDLTHTIDLVAILVLFADLLLQISRAEDKVCYVKENWLLILSFVPFGSSLRLLNFLKIIKTRGSVALKAIKIAGHASHITKLLRPIMQLFSRNKNKNENKKTRANL